MLVNSRRAFLQRAAATAVGLSLGPRFWTWAGASGPAPFGPLQDDLLLRLPEGFSYTVVAEMGLPLLEGPRRYVRPNFPDLNVVFPQSDGSVILSTGHETPPEFPLLTPAPGEEYDRVAGGAVTSIRLTPDLAFQGGAYNAGGMLANCSGSGTPWRTVLTGEEATNDFEAAHGYVWEVDIDNHTKSKISGMGRFDHETAVVHGTTGTVYLTEDRGTGHLYRYLPSNTSPTYGALAQGGVLQVFTAPSKPSVPGASVTGTWQTVADPETMPVPAGALAFKRLEGGDFDPFDPDTFYFTETADPTNTGAVWRLHVATSTLERYVGSGNAAVMSMPDNLTFDPAGNLFLTEDRSDAGPAVSNRVLFVDRGTGAVHTFAEVVQHWRTPDPPGNVADEPTGPAFWVRPDGTAVLFLNLQRAMPTFGMTLAITGPFAGAVAPSGPAALPLVG